MTQRLNLRKTLPLRFFLLTLGLVGSALAQLPIPSSSQFDITGFLQEATVTNPGDAHSGGQLKVNGHTIVIPRETIVILPANSLTWQELFVQAPAPYAGTGQTGMAQADVPTPLTTYEVHVVGNRVLGGPGGADVYIAGLVNISQTSLDSGAGFINFIDYTAGELRVGGTLGDSTTGARVRINDPTGRYGRNTTSPDIRFTVDPDNPTVISGTGFPMCFPRTNPAVADDPLCPQANRPLLVGGGFASNFTTGNLTNAAFPINPGFPRADIQAPLEVGDYITYSGTLVQDCAACSGGGTIAGPWPGGGTAATWVSAHTIVNNVAIFTFPGSDPAYVMVDTSLIGTGGLTVLGAGEATIRTRFEGMTTDVDTNSATQRLIHLYGMDLNPATGAVSDRDWGMMGVDPGPPTGAVKGRWRFRPPCTQPVGQPTDKKCSPPPSGTFLPPTREMRAVIVNAATGVPSNPGRANTAANGLIYGQYHAPISQYIFPENIPGAPVVENNFNTIDFLALGGYTSSAGTLVGTLSPWPSNVQPAGACVPPVANAGGPYTVASGGSIALNGGATGTGPFTFAWVVAAGTLSDPTLAAPNYVAPILGAQTAEGLTLTVTNTCGSSTGNSTITVNAAAAPTASVPSPTTVTSGTPVTLTGTGTDPSGLSLNFVWTQTNAGAVGVPTVLNPNPLTCAQSPSPISCSVSFTVNVPIGQTTATVIQLQGQSTNSVGIASAAASTSVTVNPAPDIITVTTAQYRTSKQRVDLSVSDSVVSPNIVLKLAPYLTDSGTIFDPASLGNTFTNNGGGLYVLTLVGAPRPACNLGGTYATPCAQRPIVVQSSLGGASPATALTSIRQ